MFILGGLMIAMGTCVGASSLLMPRDLLLRSISGMIPPELVQSSGIPPDEFLHLFVMLMTAVSVVVLLMGGIMLGLGVPVRRGRYGAMLAAAIIVAGIMIFELLNFAGTLIMTVQAPQNAGALVLQIAMIAGLSILLSSLVQALRVHGRVESLRGYYAAQAQSLPHAPAALPKDLFGPNFANAPGAAPTPQQRTPAPPPGQAPVRYGYAQPPAPSIPLPPPGDSPIASERPPQDHNSPEGPR